MALFVTHYIQKYKTQHPKEVSAHNEVFKEYMICKTEKVLSCLLCVHEFDSINDACDHLHRWHLRVLEGETKQRNIKIDSDKMKIYIAKKPK